MSDEAKRPCEHMNFSANVVVARLTSVESGPVTSYCAEIKIVCAERGKPFQFLGLEPGLDLQGARASLDGLEANIAICPEGEKPNPFQRMKYDIRSFT